MQTVKIVIEGPFGSGRTSFIKTISEIDVLQNDQDGSKANTTVAMDFGRITIDETLVLYLFGVPGARRFDFIWEVLAEGLLGFILVIKSDAPETFYQTRSLAQTFMAYAPIPFVFAANFQDHPDAWDVEALRIALQIDSDIPVVPCIATDRESVKHVLLTLLEEVLKDAEDV